MPQAPAQTGAKSEEEAISRSPPWLWRCQFHPCQAGLHVKHCGTMAGGSEGHVAAVQGNLLLL